MSTCTETEPDAWKDVEARNRRSRESEWAW